MRLPRCARTFLPILAVAFLHAAPSWAGTLDTPACKRDLTAASAGVTDGAARLKGLAKASGEQKCAAYRQQFLVAVRARAVFANCKTGPDRDTDVDRLDGTIETINGAIAESCSIE